MESSEAEELCPMTGQSWALLPEPIVVTVLTYLSLAQRLQAALTCKAWNTCLQHPLLWRRFICLFVSPLHGKVLGALDLHGHRIRCLVIRVDQEHKENRQNACKALNSMAKMRERRLNSLAVQFVGQNPLFYNGQEFVTELKLLFTRHGDSCSLSQLTHVDLSGLDILFDDSLLDLLSAGHPDLVSLNIQNKSLVCKVSPACMHRLVASCTKLRELCVFHLSLTDDVLMEIVGQEAPCLHFLSILYRRETKYAVDLSSDAWAQLVARISTLRVTLIFDHTCPLNRISQVMKPEIPVTELRLETFTRIYEEVNQATSCYHKTLEKVVLQTRNSDELGYALTRLAENCPRLQSLLVYCVLNQPIIDRILKVCPVMRQQGSYILKATMEEGPWVVGVETHEEAQERLNS